MSTPPPNPMHEAPASVVPFGLGDWKEVATRALEVTSVASSRDRAAEDPTSHDIDVAFELMQVELVKWDLAPGPAGVSFGRVHPWIAKCNPESFALHDLCIHPDDVQRARDALLQCIEREAIFELELRLSSSTHDQRWFRIKGRVELDALRQPTCMLAAIRDTTEARESLARAAEQATDLTLLRARQAEQERELRAARDLALGAMRAKSEFLASMSHELRTPLNAVIGISSLLLDTELAEDQRGYADSIRHAGRDLLVLITDILDYADMEAGGFTLETASFELGALVEEVVDMHAARAREKSLELTYWVHPDIPTRVRGDPGRLRQMLVQFVSNALEFTLRGEVSLRVIPDRAGDDPTLVRFECHDTGQGLSNEAQANVFEPFASIDPPRRRRHGGAGIRLALCRRLALMMGGSIGVESQYGLGSTFWFTARLTRERSNAQVAREADDRVLGRRALVVDESDGRRQCIQAELILLGMSVDLAEDEERAAELLRQGSGGVPKYDLVIVDARCLAAVEILLSERSQARGDQHDIATIVLMHPDERGLDMLRGRRPAMAELDKPVKPARLRALIRSLMRESKPQADGRANEVMLERPAPARARARFRRLLVAEDNAVNQMIIQKTLQALGFSVDIVDDGIACLEAVSSASYDAVLMDCRMPHMSGLDATREIRRRELSTGAHIPIVALTANDMPDDRRQCFECGMDDFVAKPFRKEELEAVLERNIAQPAEDAAQQGNPGQLPIV